MTTLREWLRILHRDWGYVMTGLCLVYGISGLVLNHLGKDDPAYETTEGTVQLSPNLTSNALKNAWKAKCNLPEIKQIAKIDGEHYRILFNRGIGIYSFNNGVVEYEQHKRKVIIYYLNKLHYNNVRGWTIMGDIFAVSLVFFAVSGLVIIKGKKGISGTGKWFVLLGILIPLVYILFM